MRYYFLGICGTAMASLAILLKQKGHEVWGSDQNVYPPMIDLLKENRIPVWEGFHLDHLKKSFDVAVIGNVFSRGNVELEEILRSRMLFASLPEIIRREFIHFKKSIVISGTHGKTTTTALMSWILETAGLSPSFLIGGISKNFQTSARLGNGDYFVIEGDEYDSAFFDKRPKFLHYFPHYLIINNIEFDHADIYRDVEQIKSEFRKLIRCMSKEALIIGNGDDPQVREVLNPLYSRLETFGRGKENDWRLEDLSFATDYLRFGIKHKDKDWGEIQIPGMGEYQAYNVLATVAVAADLGIDEATLQKALHSFQNVQRRLDYWGELNGAPFYDDFAHHPTAIRATLSAIRQRYPRRRIRAIFEPRTNTTVQNIFQRELSEALALADQVMLGPLYRAERLPPERRLDLSKIKEDLEKKQIAVTLLSDYSSIYELLESQVSRDEVIVLMTNGSLGGVYADLRDKIRGNPRNKK
ncbi:MAG: UDP-N-acetylmuramate:L-alanyl-gamma-D-glutamyl-me so-diaminopimelate ligase [Calditrichia bacterium]